MPASKSQLTTIDNAMREARLSPADYFLGILSSADHHNAAADIYNHVHYILDAIHLGCGPATLQWALTIVLGMCSTSCILGAIYEKDEWDVIQWAKDLTFGKCEAELVPLVKPNGGFHFNTENMTYDQINNFDLRAIIQRSKLDAPMVWEFLNVVMDIDTKAKYQRNRTKQKSIAQSADAREEHLDIVCPGILYSPVQYQ